MGALLPKALLAIGTAIAITGCGATDPEGASRAAERFYAATSAKDGDAACAELSEATRKQLEQDEQEPCREAVLTLQLSGRRVTAAGCKPTPGTETPYDCEVDS